MSEPLKIFVTYSHKNTEEKDELITRLTLLKGEGLISIWHDNEILPGDKWRDAIFDNLVDSDLLLYLTSVHSLISENCNKELAEALKAGIRVIPIILESCDWENHQLSDLQALPDRAKPINTWQPESDGWQNVVDGIRKTLNKLQAQTRPAPESTQNVRLAESVFQQGNFLMMIGQTSRAIEVYAYTITLDPQNVHAYYNRGVAYHTKGDFAAALRDYDKAIDLNPEYADAYTGRGAAYRDKNNFAAALRDYDKAIDLNPEYAEAYYNRGAVYGNQGDLDAALRDYSEAITLNPEGAETYIRNIGADIVAFFHKNYDSVEDFEVKHGVTLPEDVVALLLGA